MSGKPPEMDTLAALAKANEEIRKLKEENAAKDARHLRLKMAFARLEAVMKRVLDDFAMSS